MEIGKNDITGPVGDEEIPLLEHLAELRRRLIVVFVPFCIVTVTVFATLNLSTKNISLLSLFANLLPDAVPTIYVYSPMEWISVMFLFSFLCALSVTIPLLLYEVFAFMRPGLYPSEGRFFLQVVIPSLLLYGVGLLFAYFLVLPFVFSYLISHSGEIAEVAFSAKRIFSIIIYTALGFGLIFQIPLIMTLAVRMKLVTYSWLKDKRLIVYGLIVGIALFVIADPTGISMLMAGMSIALFELGIIILLFGAAKVPQLARSFGQAMGEFKKAKREAELDYKKFEESVTGDEEGIPKAEVKAAVKTKGGDVNIKEVAAYMGIDTAGKSEEELEEEVQAKLESSKSEKE